jgi:predicted HD phosphohydrolase
MSELDNKTQAALTTAIKLLWTKGTADYIGENVTQIQHALQAAEIAEERHLGGHFTLACLLHDIGHLLSPDDTMGYGNSGHAESGARWLKEIGLPDSITEPIRLHVAAKRFLITTDAEYMSQLSAASIATLKYQGGMMTDKEVREFQSQPFYIFGVELRRVDDMAKDPAKKYGPDAVLKYTKYQI